MIAVVAGLSDQSFFNKGAIIHSLRIAHTSSVAFNDLFFRSQWQEDTREVEASKYDLNYIGLTGE